MDVVIYGTGGFAREVHQIVEDSNAQEQRWNFLGWIDDDARSVGREVHGMSVLGGADWLADHAQVGVLVGVGATPSRWRIVRSIRERSANPFPTLVHPLAWLGNRIGLGEGTVVCAGSLLTTDLTVGSHTILNLDCTVGHDAVLGDFVTVAPSVNISGNVAIEIGCDLGTGATLIQGISIGHWTTVGAGAVVVRDLPANVTAVGVPAQAIKERPEGWQEERDR